MAKWHGGAQPPRPADGPVVTSLLLTLALDVGCAPENSQALAVLRPWCRGHRAGPGSGRVCAIRGDPELLYQPIKVELVRALSASRLPFWSDQFGLGIPLVAESHVAAFYPLNWVFYRVWDCRGRISLDDVAALAWPGRGYLPYARVLAISHAGSALAAISFSLCGFQAVHAPHEPFYHLMPYLLVCLYLADRFAVSGRVAYLAGLALAWGLQLTLGHFQIQMWTAGPGYRDRRLAGLALPGPIRTKLTRLFGLFMGLGVGSGDCQHTTRLELGADQVHNLFPPPNSSRITLFPISHWAQFALPAVYLGRPGGAGEAYWELHRTALGGLRLRRHRATDPGLYRLGGCPSRSGVYPLAADLPADAGSGHHGRLVAGRLFHGLADSRSGLVSSTRPVHPSDESGPGALWPVAVWITPLPSGVSGRVFCSRPSLG